MNLMRTTKPSFNRHALATQAMQAAAATRAKAKLDQAGPICIYGLCEIARRRGALQQHQHGRDVSARPSTAHPSLRATAAAAARLQLRARARSSRVRPWLVDRRTARGRQGATLGGPEGIPGRHFRWLHPHADHRFTARLLGPGLDPGNGDVRRRSSPSPANSASATRRS